MVIFHSTVTLEKKTKNMSDENKSAQLSIIMAHFCFLCQTATFVQVQFLQMSKLQIFLFGQQLIGLSIRPSLVVLIQVYSVKV